MHANPETPPLSLTPIGRNELPVGALTLRSNVLAPIETAIDLDQLPSTRHVVASSGETVIGTGSCGIVAFPNIGTARYLLRAVRFWFVAVGPAEQGKGVGTAIMDRIIQQAHELDVDLLWGSSRESALGFYERLGFEVTGPAHISPYSGITNRYVVRTLRA